MRRSVRKTINTECSPNGSSVPLDAEVHTFVDEVDAVVRVLLPPAAVEDAAVVLHKAAACATRWDPSRWKGVA